MYRADHRNDKPPVVNMALIVDSNLQGHCVYADIQIYSACKETSSVTVFFLNLYVSTNDHRISMLLVLFKVDAYTLEEENVKDTYGKLLRTHLFTFTRGILNAGKHILVLQGCIIFFYSLFAVSARTDSYISHIPLSHCIL